MEDRLAHECPNCLSGDTEWEPLFPRERTDDKHYECLECGCEWDVFVSNKIEITKQGKEQ